MVKEGDKDDGRGDSSMIYVIYWKKFCKCHNVYPVQQ
jgi:hypothetical protein